jgi:hypothetical protein
MLILNEVEYARNIYIGKDVGVKSIMEQIRYITRYLVFLEQQDDECVYANTIKWLKSHQNNFDESYYSNIISDAIKKAHKYPFYVIDNIQVTKSELDAISSLDDLRAEKVCFVLLCMAKQQRMSNGFTNGLVRYSITEVCKLARVSVPSEDREYIFHKILKNGLISSPKKNDTKCLIVNFIDFSDVVLELSELDCQELAYVYLNWKNKGEGYGRCEFCGRLMKQPKKNPNRFCEDCSSKIGDVADDKKVISCVNCGELIYVDSRNNSKERCNACQEQYRKEYMKILMRNKRSSDNSVSK